GRQYHRAAGSQGIGGGTGRRTDDEAVATVTGDRFVIDTYVQGDQSRYRAAADDNVVEGGFANKFACAIAADLDEGAGFEFEFAGPNLFQGIGQGAGRDGGQESEAADIDAEQGCFVARDIPGSAQHGAIAAKNKDKVGLAGQGGDVAVDDDSAAGAFDEFGRFADDAGAGRFFHVADQSYAFDFFT